MIKRMVPVGYWSEAKVLDNYSLEDRLFHIYLLTNQHSSQLGIYKLNKQYMALESGIDREFIDQLLDRFEHIYHVVAYNHDTQEISILRSLEHSIIRGGKPVCDLLKKEFSNVEDNSLILKTYEAMLPFWDRSKRSFDSVIKNLFISELANRQVEGFKYTEPETNQKKNEKQNDNDNEKQNDNDNQTQKQTQKSWVLSDNESSEMTKDVSSWKETLTEDAGTVLATYQLYFGEITKDKFDKLTYYLESMTVDVVIKAIELSIKAAFPYKYCLSILGNWHKNDVHHLGDVMEQDKVYQGNYRMNQLLEPYKELEIPLINL